MLFQLQKNYIAFIQLLTLKLSLKLLKIEAHFVICINATVNPTTTKFPNSSWKISKLKDKTQFFGLWMVEKGPREKPALTTPYYFLALIIIFYFIIYFISLFYAGFEVLIHFELKTTHTFTALLIRNIISVSEQPPLRQHMLLWNVNCSKNTLKNNKC